MAQDNVFSKVYCFYRDGFKNLSPTARKLWIIVIIKLFIMFAILKVFFFPSELGKYDTDAEKAQAVRTTLINR